MEDLSTISIGGRAGQQRSSAAAAAGPPITQGLELSRVLIMNLLIALVMCLLSIALMGIHVDLARAQIADSQNILNLYQIRNRKSYCKSVLEI